MHRNFSLSLFTNEYFSIKYNLVVILYFRSIGGQISQPHNKIGFHKRCNDTDGEGAGFSDLIRFKYYFKPLIFKSDFAIKLSPS